MGVRMALQHRPCRFRPSGVGNLCGRVADLKFFLFFSSGTDCVEPAGSDSISWPRPIPRLP
jgi:hypothetical protein